MNYKNRDRMVNILAYPLAGLFIIILYYDIWICGGDGKGGTRSKIKQVNGVFYRKNAGLINVFKPWVRIFDVNEVVTMFREFNKIQKHKL